MVEVEGVFSERSRSTTKRDRERDKNAPSTGATLLNFSVLILEWILLISRSVNSHVRVVRRLSPCNQLVDHTHETI